MGTFLAIAAALVAGVTVHLWWSRRYARLRGERDRLEAGGRELEALQRKARVEAEAWEQALFNSMVEGLLVLDGKGRVRLVNQALVGLFGLSGDIRGLTLMEAFRMHRLQDLLERVRTEVQVLGVELELPGLDGRFLQVNATGFLDGTGKPQGVVFVFHELTRLKQLENTRREFVANVSHELRTPLSIIKGYVETLINGAREDPDVAVRFLQIIDRHADRLTYLIEDLLTISRLESGQVVMNLQPSELRPIAETVLEDLRVRAVARHVTLTDAVPAGLEANLDADRIQQVLFNLVDNAIQYGRMSGRAEIRARAREDGMVEVAVEDDGPGIPSEATERIFERFYRVDKARSREHGGTGLGLAIVKHIVHSHRGEVWVRSELGKGTTFYFTLPAVSR